MSETLEELKRKFFIEELGMDEKDIPEAERNLLGFFETLLEIDGQQANAPV